MNARQVTKTLLLIRHAQSAGIQGNKADFERPLTAEGRTMSNNLGTIILEKAFRADYILSSSAIRTRETAALINKKLLIPEACQHFSDDLYTASANNWRDQIGLLPSRVSCVLLVGHNPALSELASLFHKADINLSPGGMIGFAFEINHWHTLNGNGEEIIRFLNPG